jgi:hypothetical protein
MRKAEKVATNLRWDLVSEQPTSSSGWYSPGFDVFRVTPDQIAKGAFMWDFLCSGNHSYLIQSADFRRKSTMHTEYFAIDDGSQGKKVEDLATAFPDGGVAILLLTFLVEAIDLGDLTRFVVAAN